MGRIPQSGELYRHFKNKMYQIITVAKHSETGEMLVIYQALYGDYKTYARPLELFISEVDHAKYPEVTQKYRFEKVAVSPEGIVMPVEDDLQNTANMDVADTLKEVNTARTEINENERNTAEIDEKSTETEDESAGVDPKLLEFLDAEDFEERYNILVSMRDTITDKLVNDLAVVLDVVIPEGALDERYEALKMCIRTRQKYESDRLR